jgi:hypothetical protein
VIKNSKLDLAALALKYWLEASIGLLALVVLGVGFAISHKGSADAQSAGDQASANGSNSGNLLVLGGPPTVLLDSVSYGSIHELAHYTKPYHLKLNEGQALTLTGWSFDNMDQEAPAEVFAQVDAYARVKGLLADRPDVAKYFHDDRYTHIGYTFVIPTSTLTVGMHQLSFLAENSAHSGYHVVPDWIDVEVVPSK